MIRKMLLVAFYVLIVSLNSLEFEHIGKNKAFETSVINNIYLDKTGYLWIASNDGLYRFDGKKTDIWKYSPKDTLSISSNLVTSIVEDGNNDICIGTMQGLSILNRTTNKITRYFNKPNNPFPLKDAYISNLYTFKDGRLFISTYQDGMIIYNPKTKSFKKYFISPNISLYECHNDANGDVVVSSSKGFYKFNLAKNKFVKLSSNSIYAEFKDKKVLTFMIEKNFVWICTDELLYKINIKTHKSHKIKLEKSGAQPKIFSLENYHHKLLIGTNYGFYIYDKMTEKIDKYINDANDPTSLSDNFISKIIVDPNENIFIATDKGVEKINFISKKFHKISNIGSAKEKTDIVSIFNDSKNNLWVGKYGAGVFLWDRNKYKKPHWKAFNTKNSSIPDNFIYAIEEDENGKIWLATDRGLAYFDYTKNKMFKLNTENTDFNNIETFCLKYLPQDKNIWVGTISLGLFSYNTLTGEVNNFIANDTLSTTKKYQSVVDLTIDNKNRLWLNTNGKGIVSFDRKKHKFSEYNRKINGNYVDDVIFSEKYQDGTIWIGTFYSGITVFDPEFKTFYHLPKSKVLTNHTIYGIVFDNNGDAWISTFHNLYKYRPKVGICEEFNFYDGVLKELNAYSYSRDKSGNIYFGGRSGINWFNPDSIKYNEYHPKVHISSVNIDSIKIIINPYNYQKIIVHPKQHRLEINFSVLDYTIPSKNTAYYKLVNYNKDWIKAKNSFTETFGNLPGGDYVFEVKGLNNDGKSGENIAKLNIHVITPFTKSHIFFVIIGLLVILLLILIIKYRTYKLSKKKAELEKLVALRTEQLKEKANQLTRTNKIIKMVNSQISFDAQLSQIIEESKIFPDLEYLDVYVLNSTRNIYIVKKSITKHKDAISLDEKDYLNFKNNSHKITDHIWIDTDFSEISFIHTLYRSVTNILLLEFEVENTIVGFIIFGMNYSVMNYSSESVKILEELSMHFGAIFQRGILVEKLEEINKKKNEIIGIAAHDLRNPLSGIISSTEMIDFHLKKSEPNLAFIKKNITMTLNSALRMDKLIKDLLSTSEIESGKVELDKKPHNIADIFEASLKSFQENASKKNIKLTIEKIDLPLFLIDESRIFQLADNLISNAVKYTLPGGEVMVSFEIVGDFVYVNVKDNGQGLSEEDLKHVFKSFKKLSARPTGGESSTGLGLAIAQRIVEMHGGKIWVNSKKGDGATFSFAIPIESQENNKESS